MFDKSLNKVIQLVTSIKLNKKTTGSWITVTGSGNATGKQGAARPATALPTDKSTDEENYLSKRSYLTHPEVSILIQKLLCMQEK